MQRDFVWEKEEIIRVRFPHARVPHRDNPYRETDEAIDYRPFVRD